MKIKTLIVLLLVISILLGAVIASLTYRLRGELFEVEIAQERQHNSYLIADKLRQSSDDLTRFARSYVITGDPKFEQFFKQVLMIRNGELPLPEDYDGVYWDLVVAGQREGPNPETGEPISLDDRMREAGFIDSEFSLLDESQARSDELVHLETRAMNALKGLYQDETGEYTVEGDPDRALASSLLYGEKYHLEKARIMEPIDSFLNEVERRTNAELRDINSSVQEKTAELVIVTLLLVMLQGLAGIAFYFRIIRRANILVSAANRISDGDWQERSGITGKDELGTLGRTFDLMVGRLSGSLNQAQAEAREMHSQVEAIFQKALDGIVIVSAETLQVENANPAAEKFLGDGTSQISGMPIHQLISDPQESNAVTVEHLRSIAQSGSSVEFQGRYSGGFAATFETMVNESVFDGSPVFILSLRDISQWKDLVDQRTRELRQVSTPVTQIWEGVLLLPLVGTVDSSRAEDVTNSCLKAIQDNDSRVLLLDIAGVARMDEEVIGYLYKVVRASRLMGCECVVSGVSPEVAEALVETGVDFQDVRTTATMRDGLAWALAQVRGQ